jgi:hypothetical protein
MHDILKSMRGFVIGIAIFLGIVILAAFLIKGGIWLSVKILPWLSIIMWFVFIVDILLILPLGIFRKTKGFSAIVLVVSSYVYGLTLWFWSLLITYLIWGAFVVFIGLFIAGVGVVPIAIIATIIKGEWDITWQILLLLFLTFGSRMLGYHFAKQADEITYSTNYN